jgi:D-alanyl-D-alanine carboxypeptidase
MVSPPVKLSLGKKINIKDDGTVKQTDDIPEARRETIKNSSWVIPPWLQTGGVVLAMALVGLTVLTLLWRAFSAPRPVVQVSPSPTPIIPQPSPIPNILGHLPYSQAATKNLLAVTADGKIRLRRGAAQKFLQMQGVAKKQGVLLVPLSGFRSVKEQEHLFFGVKAQRNQETRKRAEVSAPPGYSEHHTGYAIDIGDGQVPATNVSRNFEKTKAFQWLKKHAAAYSFELSFPLNNPQGVNYEPWHWRYVGDTDSLKTFYQAQQLQQKKR